MEIQTVIERIKRYHKGYGVIDETRTRDKILWGSPLQECTGIVVCLWASVDIIRKALDHHANLIICHEALFWNHGDHTDWLEGQNEVFEQKKALLDKGNICVWRDHDYIHSGIPIGDGQYADGIFYGFAKEAAWLPYLVSDERSMNFHMPPCTVESIAHHLLEAFNLEGMRLIGSPETKVENVEIIFHVLADAKEQIEYADRNSNRLLIAMELIDFTLAEYMHDATQLGRPAAVLSMGHFNTEEPGMRYCLEYFPAVIGEDIPMWFESDGDYYHYVTR